MTTLTPAASTSSTVSARLTALAAGIGTNGTDYELDDLVHDAASQIGSAVNRDGLGSKIDFLVEQLGAAETEKALRNIAISRIDAALKSISQDAASLRTHLEHPGSDVGWTQRIQGLKTALTDLPRLVDAVATTVSDADGPRARLLRALRGNVAADETERLRGLYRRRTYLLVIITTLLRRLDDPNAAGPVVYRRPDGERPVLSFELPTRPGASATEVPIQITHHIDHTDLPLLAAAGIPVLDHDDPRVPAWDGTTPAEQDTAVATWATTEPAPPAAHAHR